MKTIVCKALMQHSCMMLVTSVNSIVALYSDLYMTNYLKTQQRMGHYSAASKCMQSACVVVLGTQETLHVWRDKFVVL